MTVTGAETGRRMTRQRAAVGQALADCAGVEVVRSTGFADVEHTLELTGICDGCRSGANDGGSDTPPPP